MTENALEPNEIPPEQEEDEVDSLEEYEPDPKPIPQFLVGLEQYEEVLNEGAVKIARAHRIPDGKWKIHLVGNVKGGPVMHIKAGAVAQIILTWPDAQKHIKRHLEDAFRFINKHNIIDTFAIQSTLYARQLKDDVRKWIKKECGEENELLLDLIPKYRLIETVTTTYKLEDTKTGKSIEVTTTTKDRYTNKRDMSHWIALSRKVREVEAPDLSDESASETPELDKVENERTNL